MLRLDSRARGEHLTTKLWSETVQLCSYTSQHYAPNEWFVITASHVVCELWNAFAIRKVRHRSVDLKYVQENVLKSVTMITKSGGSI